MRFNKVLIFVFILNFAFGQEYPPGFQEQNFSSEWETPMGLVFDHAGKMYVFERAGKIYKYDNEQKNLLIDISDEVSTSGDFGLLSTVLDPNFASNGYIYLFYAVRRHHLLYFGTPEYETEPDSLGASICRVTRFTLDINTNFTSLVPNSRHVILGQTKSTGVPCTGINHAGGQMNFAMDGTLLISTGDGSRGADFELQAFQDGIVTQEEYNVVIDFFGTGSNSGQWRSQLINSLNGKILRIDPSTGHGISSNPFYNSNAPESNSSKVWALGFRNPFRFTIRPGTGSHQQGDGNPGVLVVGDVGQDTKEEINMVTQGGQNFGWPYLEGIDHVFLDNQPNHVPSNPIKPTVEWGRDYEIKARVVINNQVHNVGSTTFDFPDFTGRAAIGGGFYGGAAFPEAYHGTYFFADYDSKWVKCIKFDANNNPISKVDFSPSIENLTYFTYNPFDESMYYVTNSRVARIFYAPGGNQNPLAEFTYTPRFGASPLNVSFDASNSSDPENAALSYSWNFGDNTTATNPIVSHTFTANSSSAQTFNITLTVTDEMGATNSITKQVSVNNSPPQILSTSLDNLIKFSNSGNTSINLNAVVLDPDEPNSTLKFNWEVFLYHNNHNHPEFSGNNLNETVPLGKVDGCEVNLYFYRFILHVEDSFGLITSFQKDLYPICNTSDVLAPEVPQLRVDTYAQKKFELKWNPVIDNFGVKHIEVFINGVSKLVLSGNSVKYTFNSNSNLNGQNFNAYIIARDYGGNAVKSPTIYFEIPSETCNTVNEIQYLSDLTPSSQNGYAIVHNDLSFDSTALTLDGIVYPKGLGMHAISEVTYNISGFNYSNFSAQIGVDDAIYENTFASVIFKVFKDNTLAYTSPIMRALDSTIPISIDVLNVNELRLVVENAGDFIWADHANWADAKLTGACLNMDFEAPSNPLNFTSSRFGNTIALNWNSSIDNQDTSLDYEVWIDGVFLGLTTDLFYSISNFPIGKHTVTVQAIDNYGNISVSKNLEIDFNLCPSTNTLTNTFLIQNQNTFYKASVSISAANQIINSSNVLYQSGQNIELLPGFIVESGSVFTAKIAGCLD